jgi:hypothetical protein
MLADIDRAKIPSGWAPDVRSWISKTRRKWRGDGSILG